MKKKRLFRRKHKAAHFGQMFGVELFEDSRLLRIVLCRLHYDTVDRGDDDPPFPLADLADPTATNANLVMYLLRQHQAEAQVHLVHHHRYFHRDSQDPSDGLDLKRTYIHTASVLENGIEAMVLDFCRFIATDGHFALRAPPAVYDFSAVPIDVAIDAMTQLPFMHTRVLAPEAAGLQ
jgi:hypothetical protein